MTALMDSQTFTAETEEDKAGGYVLKPWNSFTIGGVNTDIGSGSTPPPEDSFVPIRDYPPIYRRVYPG